MNHDMIEFLSRLDQLDQTIEGWDWEVKLTPRQKKAVDMLRKDLQECYTELIESLAGM